MLSNHSTIKCAHTLISNEWLILILADKLRIGQWARKLIADENINNSDKPELVFCSVVKSFSQTKPSFLGFDLP